MAMAMTGAALLRSAATEMARAPSRVPPSALQHHGHGLLLTSSSRLWVSRFSASAGSTPPPTNLRGPQTYNKKVPSGNGLDSFMTGIKGAAPTVAYGMVFGGFAFLYFYVIPTLDRIDAKLEALNEEMQQLRNLRRHAALDSMGSQVEATDVVGEFSKGQRIQASGQGKEHL